MAIEGEIWHRTGDLGSLDVSGLKLHGRVGHQFGAMSPFQLELMLQGEFPITRCCLMTMDQVNLLLVELPRKDLSSELLESISCFASRKSGITIQIKAIDGFPMDRRHNAKINRAALLKLIEKPEASEWQIVDNGALTASEKGRIVRVMNLNHIEAVDQNELLESSSFHLRYQAKGFTSALVSLSIEGDQLVCGRSHWVEGASQWDQIGKILQDRFKRMSINFSPDLKEKIQ